MPATFEPRKWVNADREVEAVPWPGGPQNAQNIIDWLASKRWMAEYHYDPEFGEYIETDTYGPRKKAWPGWVFAWDGVGVRVYAAHSFTSHFKRVSEPVYAERTPQED